MQPQQDPRLRRDTMEPTDARQGNRKKGNFRVLLTSMALAVAVGVVLVAGFWHETPPAVDASSGGNPSQNTGQSPTTAPATPTTPESAPAPQRPSTP
ncbi:MAG: hypothetical protein ABWZ19_04470 [Hyphomicrobium sp.]